MREGNHNLNICMKNIHSQLKTEIIKSAGKQTNLGCILLSKDSESHEEKKINNLMFSLTFRPKLIMYT